MTWLLALLYKMYVVCTGDDEQSLIDRDIFLEAYDSIEAFPCQLKLIPACVP